MSRNQSAPKRWALVALAVIGAGLIAAPGIFHMWHRAPLGAEMIDEFAPYMTAKRLDGYQRELREIDAGVKESNARLPSVLFGAGVGAHRRFDARYADFAAFRDRWQRVIYPDMGDLLNRIQANRTNYDAVAALPSFKLFPWFFVIPGALVLLAAGALLLRPAPWGSLRWALVALGVGLILAPAVFQMFSRAPKGGHMMDAFETIETRHKVETIQGYFGDIAVGQGVVRLELIPALEKSGLTRAQIDARYPDVSTFDRRWAPILNDLTPMIGTMSDNVDNYQAVKALPPFPLFPWFFVAPGLIILGLVFAAQSTSTRKITMTPLTSSRAGVGVLALAAATLALSGASKDAAAAPAVSAKALTGTFTLSPGRYTNGKASGTYFRMIFPGGGRKYFKNPDSRAKDKTFTLLRPGTSGGLVTGRFQPHPRRPFDGTGNSLARAITRPQKFAGIAFGLATLPKDPQSGKKVSAPAIRVSGRTLTGQLQAFTAEWNKLYFNQGAPKPGGSAPLARGTYNPRTGAYNLVWTSLIKGGAFNGFTGYWHLAGTFRRGSAASAAGVVAKKRKPTCKHKHRKGTKRHTHKRCVHRKAKRKTTPPAPPPTGGQALTGTFKLAPGTYSSSAGVGGSYFRMIFPGGSVERGPYFDNPSSTASSKSYTLVRPGTDGGLITGSYQEPPTPAFGANGGALANRIIQPQRFAGVDFSLSTAAKDAQAGHDTPTPSISVTDGKLSGQVTAFTASWNRLWFNQGSPKPDGTLPGRTTPVSGTYDAGTKAYVLEWASKIVDGPFNGFTGYWHLAGTFEPAAVTPPPPPPLLPPLVR